MEKSKGRPTTGLQKKERWGGGGEETKSRILEECRQLTKAERDQTTLLEKVADGVGKRGDGNSLGIKESIKALKGGQLKKKDMGFIT